MDRWKSGLETGLLAGILLLGGCGGDTEQPLPGKFQFVAAGVLHSCGIVEDGTAFCWGNNSFGQLGDGSRSTRTFPVDVAGSVRFVQLTLGGGHTCGIATTGAVYCWGFNLNGQLGDRTHIDRATAGPVEGGLTFLSVSAGGSYNCGIAADSTAYCWGWNGMGQLGDSTLLDSSVPKQVVGGRKFRAISASFSHTCGLTAAGQAYCWGANDYGEVGTGNNEASQAPVAVQGGVTFTRIQTGYSHTCGVATNGDGYCWGRNQYGQLGGGEAVGGQNQLLPLAVDGGIDWGSISSGAYFSCGVEAAGSAFCWGYNGSGQLGTTVTTTCTAENGAIFQCTSTPTPVNGGLKFALVSASTQHVCGLTLDGVAYCWGFDSDGQLGDGRKGTTAFAIDPVKVGGQP